MLTDDHGAWIRSLGGSLVTAFAPRCPLNSMASLEDIVRTERIECWCDDDMHTSLYTIALEGWHPLLRQAKVGTRRLFFGVDAGLQSATPAEAAVKKIRLLLLGMLHCSALHHYCLYGPCTPP